MGRILRIDLSQKRFHVDPLEKNIAKDFIGGIGTGIRILFDEVPDNIDAFDPRNRLIFSTGPLTGTIVPGSGTYCAITKSPLTGSVGAAQGNGFFGAYLKFANYDAIVIHGKSDKLVYIYIDPENVLILDGDLLLGKDVFETERILKAKHNNGKYRLSVACIGPAGENLVRFACIHNDQGHFAASGGVGSVMGSKKLKAIIVGGNHKVPIAEERKAHFKALVKEWGTNAIKSGPGRFYHDTGTAGLFPYFYSNGWVPVKNLTTNIFPNHALFDGAVLRNGLFERVKKTPCYACILGHCNKIRLKTGNLMDLEGEEPEYEDLAGWGPNVGIDDPIVATQLSYLNDSLGMDVKESSFVISLLMECFEKGIVTKKDTHDIEIRWGNYNAIESLLKLISVRSGFGNVLAEGVMRASKIIGGDASNFAVYFKNGFAPHVHDPRTRWGTFFSYIISDTGSFDGFDLTTNASPDLGILDPVPFPDKNLAEAQVKTNAKIHLYNSLLNCWFLNQGTDSLNTVVKTLSCVTGFDYSVETALKVGERIGVFLRMFSINNGFNFKNDTASPRVFEPPIDGPKSGKTIKPHIEELKQQYYRFRGWDEKGVPTAETLHRLGIK